MKGKIAAVGERDIIEPLKMVGIDIYPVSKDNVKEVFAKVVDKEYSIVLIGEDSIEGMESLFLKLSLKPTTSIVPIPGKGKSKGFAYNRLRETIKRAVGTDILKEEK